MGIRVYKSYTSGTRGRAISDFAEITKQKPEKTLLSKKVSTGGRNNRGVITTRHHGGGHKQRYRIIDFKRKKLGIEAKVAAIEYDPNRNARIALLHYKDGEKRYILQPKNLNVGATVFSGETAPLEIGNALPLSSIPLGISVHNIELIPGRGGQLARAAGSYAQIVAKEGEFVTLKIRDAIWEDDGFFLNPVFNKTESIVKVEQNVCFKVDSIDFRIDKGFFGFKILSSNAIIIPNKYCDNRLCEDSTTKDYETYFNNGQELTKIRCYYQAICEFNKAINLNKTESKTYYYRGTSFLALQNYRSALIDFYIALEIEKAKNSETEIEQAFKENPYKLVSSILTDLESNNISKIESLDIEGKLNKIQLANKFDNYTTRINYCIKKLKKN